MTDRVGCRPTLLVIGASGYLGSAICQYARRNWNVVGGYLSTPLCAIGVQSVRVDLGRWCDVRDVFDDAQPNAVIHTAAMADPNACEQDPKSSDRTNVEASVNIAKLCGELETSCIFVSSDLVFKGDSAPYSVGDEPNPINRYGEQKLRAEQAMATHCDKSVTCRISPLCGQVDGAPRRGFLGPIIAALNGGKEINAFVDEIRTPVEVGAVADMLLKIAASRLNSEHASTDRLFHLGGPDRLSRYQLAIELAKSLSIDPSKINPTNQSDIRMVAARPADVSLDSSLAAGIGFQPQSVMHEFRGI